MRYRISGLAFRRSVAAAALIAGAVSLAGCSSLGSQGFIDPTTTGSAGKTVGTATTQQMPAPLASQAAGDGPYVPPVDVGPRAIVPVTTASTAQATVAPAGTGVTSQPLPPIISSGSQQSMPAQTAVKVATSPTPAATGPVHVVVSGESLYVIARKYGVEPSAIVKANDLISMDKIYVGQKLIIPGGRTSVTSTTPTTTASIATTPPKTTPAAKPQASDPVAVAVSNPTVAVQMPDKPAVADGKFRWPVSGTVITDFADSRSGINIAAQEGTAVRAVAAGTVIYTGSAVQGYGNLILIKHDDGYVSAYAHLKDITVAKGEEVTPGEAIGTTGMTGGVARPQLHFELRKGATPVDPEPLLAG